MQTADYLELPYHRVIQPDKSGYWSAHVLELDGERVGYPTQKPPALLDRIIRASSNEGDVVLDPFCGCATACVAAEKLERQWLGIDISPKAADLVRSRLQNEVGMFWQGAHREDVPTRTDLGDMPPYNADQNKRTLYGQQEGQCNGCLTLFPYRNMTIDHVVPRDHGGSHHISNLQLLCGACNSTRARARARARRRRRCRSSSGKECKHDGRTGVPAGISGGHAGAPLPVVARSRERRVQVASVQRAPSRNGGAQSQHEGGGSRTDGIRRQVAPALLRQR